MARQLVLMAVSLVSWFVRLLGVKESQAMPVPLTVEAQLFLHKRKRAPEARETGGQLQPILS